MNQVETGVANFRQFQGEMRDFTSWFRGREEERERTDKTRSRIHFWLLGILSGIIVAGFAATLTWAINFEQRHHVSVQTHETQQMSDGR